MSKRTALAAADSRDAQERDRLLLEQLPQVRYLAGRIHARLPRHIPLEDMVHAGVIGLIDALDRFDGSKNVLFSTYAKFRIRGAILDSLREMDWGPRELRRQARRIEEVLRKLHQDLSRTPTELEMAAGMNLKLGEFQQLLDKLNSLEISSLSFKIVFEGKEVDLCEYLPNPSEDTAFSLCLRSERSDMVARAIATLSEREKQVLALYYFEELSLKRVGKRMGIGESRVSQIRASAVDRVRSQLERLMGVDI